MEGRKMCILCVPFVGLAVGLWRHYKVSRWYSAGPGKIKWVDPTEVAGENVVLFPDTFWTSLLAGRTDPAMRALNEKSEALEKVRATWEDADFALHKTLYFINLYLLVQALRWFCF